MTDQPLHLARKPGLTRRASVWPGAPFPGAIMATVVTGAAAAALGPSIATTPAVAAALCMFVSGVLVMLKGLARSYPHAEFGPANTVTLLRLALVSVLAAAVLDPRVPTHWAVPALATVLLMLDGVDGWLARRTGLTSRFGARFDMEVDCVLALTLALLVYEGGKVGPWVLTLGLARYAFWAAALVLPWLAGPLPERRSRKTVCVAQILVLIALVSPAVGPAVAPALAAAMLGFVAWSFAIDIRYLHRRPR